MKKNSVILSFLLAFFMFTSCATVYQAPDLATRIQRHKKIAFLPFDAFIQYKKLPKNTTVEQLKEMEVEMGFVFQEQMYSRFLRQIKYYNIEIQDIANTNTLLKKNNIEYSQLNDYSKNELAQILGVDAVVSGKIVTSQPMSVGGAIAMNVLFGYSGATNEVNANVSLHDGFDSNLLFKYDHTYSGGLGSSAENLSKAIMKDIERKFPYRKQL